MHPESSQQLRIFLAEDNRADAYLVEVAMRENNINFTLQVVADGEEALDLVKRFGGDEPAPDIAILDLNLPRQEGDAVMAALRDQPCCASTPIIVMTSSERERDRALADQYRAIFFPKPPDLAGFFELGRLVKSLAEKSLQS